MAMTSGRRCRTCTEKFLGSGRTQAGTTYAPESCAAQRRSERARTSSALLLAGEVLGRHLVEELLEAVHDFLGVLDLVLELDRRLGDDVLGGEDRRAGSHGQGERVARPRVDLDLTSVDGERDRGEERVVAQLGD